MQTTSDFTVVPLGGEITIGGDLTVRRFGYGAMRLTGDGIWGPPRDKAAALAVLRRVIESGVNFIDTADSYGPGVSEELIAEALHPYPKDLVIATKAGLRRTGPGEWPIDAHPDRLKQCCEESLHRLKLDCIDLYQLHRIDPKVPVEESLGAFVELQQAGKIKHIGVSQVSVAELERCKKTATVVSVQNLYNVSDRDAEDVVKVCERDGLAFLPWYPLGGGDKLDHKTVDRIAREKNVSAQQIAIAWLLARSPSILPIAGTSSLEHFNENLAATSIVLSKDDLQALEGGA